MATDAEESGAAAPAWGVSEGERRLNLPSAPCSPVVCSTNGDHLSEAPIRMSSDHCRRDVVIINEMGLHARPASLFVEMANKFKSDVTIYKGNEQVDGRSILQLLSLSAEAGSTFVLETRGPDAEAAIEALCGLVTAGFNEMPASERGNEGA